jgi:hypothetical protein
MNLLNTARQFLRLGIIQSPALQFTGAIPDQQSLAANMNAVILNGQSAAGGINFVTSAAATALISSGFNLLLRLTNGGAVVVTIDSAYNIANNLPQPDTFGQKFQFQIVATGATTVATPTLSDTAVTLAGTTSVLAAASRWYQGQITQLTSTTGITTTAGTTFVSLTQVGTTNNFTVVLGTNAIVPVVGQLIFLNVTAGTLPSGWYPINLVTSATSFVIATPAGTVWTATAATVGTSTVAPPTFSPLITITGLWATATAVATV